MNLKYTPVFVVRGWILRDAQRKYPQWMTDVEAGTYLRLNWPCDRISTLPISYFFKGFIRLEQSRGCPSLLSHLLQLLLLIPRMALRTLTHLILQSFNMGWSVVEGDFEADGVSSVWSYLVGPALTPGGLTSVFLHWGHLGRTSEAIQMCLQTKPSYVVRRMWCLDLCLGHS